ncbi:YitT family protein [Neobacillus jeddahensis]|uniref:YitT family protein n=1 Tax=Neobacillus jeddahensis TaxID=1461580 RepID=UPI000A4E03AE|nr:YitT family protein [Neobacillus jeddahensis]
MIIYQRLLATLIGSFLLGIGINGFLVPNQLIDGGIIGIALIIHYFFHFQTGIMMFLLCLPICILAAKHEKGTFFSSIQGLFISSLFIDLLSPLRTQFTVSNLMSALIGGVLIGTGVALMLRYGTSTGGTDLLAKIIAKTTSLDIAIVIILIDGLIVAAGFAFLEIDRFLYSCLAIVTGGLTTSLLARHQY